MAAAGAIPTYSLVDVIEGKVPAEQIAGRMIFIGVTALATGDMFPLAFRRRTAGRRGAGDRGGRTSRTINICGAHPSTWVIDFVVAALLSMLAFFAANQRSLALAAIATIALWGLTFAGAAVRILVRLSLARRHDLCSDAVHRGFLHLLRAHRAAATDFRPAAA